MVEAEFDCGMFRLTQQIGKGGMATVWRGHHSLSGRPVAVKFLTQRWSVTDAFLRAFRQEIRAMAALDHPNVLAILDHGITDEVVAAASDGQLEANTPYFAMEYADSGDLKSFKTPLPWSKVVAILRQILAGLAYSHAQGLIHRDLKPENILLFQTKTDEMLLKLSDFGVAHVIDSERQQDLEDGIIGTPNYMAPEQFECEWREFGPWTDIYAVGCLAFRLLTGSHVYKEKNLMTLAMAHLKGDLPNITTFYPAPRGLQDWFKRMLATRTQDRFQCCADVLHAIDKIHENPLERSLVKLQQQSSVHPAFSLDIPPVAKTLRHVPMIHRSDATTGLTLHEWKTLPIFGRDQEKEQLWQALLEVSETASPRAVLLRGLSGHGKSLLSDWLCREAHKSGVARFATAIANSAENVPGQDLTAMLVQFLRTWDLEGKSLLRHLERYFGSDHPRMVARVADMISGNQLTPRQRFEACEAVFRAVSKNRPFILVLEDLQWSLDGIGLMKYLMKQPDLPLLIVGTVREEANDTLGYAMLPLLKNLLGTREIEVGPLSFEAMLRLIGYYVKLEESLAIRVAQCSDGSPLYAVQLLNDWARRHMLQPSEQGFVFKSGVALEIPQSMHQVWQDKIEALLVGKPGIYLVWLQYAAALGEQVDIEEWVALCDDNTLASPLEMLDLLEEQQLAKVNPFTWQFIHGMLRECLRSDAIERGNWQKIHKDCAAMLAKQDEGRRGHTARMGYHLIEAGAAVEALPYLLKGAKELRETSDYNAALGMLKQHAEILQQGEPQPELAESWTLRARIFLHQGRLEEALKFAEKAMNLAAEHGWLVPQCEALRLVADAQRRTGALENAFGLYQNRKEIDPDDACQHAAAACYWGMGDIARQWDRLEDARSYYELSRSFYVLIDDQHGVGDYYIGMGDLQRQIGCWSQAIGFYERGQQQFEKLGNQYGVARALNSQGDVYRLRDILDKAEPLFERAATLLRTVHSVEALFPELNLALLKLRREAWAEATQILEELWHELERLHWRSVLALVNLARSLLALVRGEEEMWARLYHPAIAVIEETGISDPDITWLRQTITLWLETKQRARENAS